MPHEVTACNLKWNIFISVAMQSKVDAVRGPPVDMPAIKHSLSEWFRLAKTRTNEGKEKRREKARLKKALLPPSNE